MDRFEQDARERVARLEVRLGARLPLTTKQRADLIKCLTRGLRMSAWQKQLCEALTFAADARQRALAIVTA